MKNNNLYKKLTKYNYKHIYPLHMPGHKRLNKDGFDMPSWLTAVYKHDITEVVGFDDLSNPNGILKIENDNIAKLYSTVKSYMLVNGSTCGLLSAINAIVPVGGSIIVAENCHMSVHNAIEIGNRKVQYLPVEKVHLSSYNYVYGYISRDKLESLCRNSKAKAVVVVSPTYEGVVLNIKEIASIVHSFNMILIVDEAHGAHLSFFSPELSAIKYADIVIQSLHKTLPCLTGTSILHVCSKKISLKNIQHSINIFQTSSPSYILLSSISWCVDFIKNNINIFKKFKKKIISLRSKINKIDKSILFDGYNCFGYDISRLVINAEVFNLKGKELFDILYSYKLEPEMFYKNYVVLITTIFDNYNIYDYLYLVLKKIYSSKNKIKKNEIILPFIKKLIGTKAKNNIYLTKPCIIIVREGSIITRTMAYDISNYIKAGISIIGL